MATYQSQYTGAQIDEAITEIRDFSESTIPISATTTSGKYLDYNGISLGEDWTTKLQDNGNSTYLATALNLSSYVGKKLRITASAWSSGSARAMGFCNSNNIISAKYAEANIPDPAGMAGFTPVGNKYVAILNITDSYFFFSMSNPSNVVTFDVISDGLVTRLKENFYTKDEVDQLFGGAYVDGASGSDSNDGSLESPFATIQKAIDSGFKNILVREGTFTAKRIYLANKTGVRISINKTYSAFNPSTANTNPKVVIDCNSSVAQGIYISGCQDIIIEGIEVKNATGSGVYITGSSGIVFRDCVVHEIPNGMGFESQNSNIDFIDCGAYNIGTLGGSAHRDGFNLHGTGIQNLLNCWANYCEDDGVSHHDACEGYVDGGEWHHCGKGGVCTPTHGAKVNVQNVYAHDCGYGIYAGNDTAALAKTFNISNSVCKNNTTYDIYVTNNTANIWNCIYDTINHSGTGTNNIFS